VLATLTKAMTMNIRPAQLIPAFALPLALLLAAGCAARSPLDTLDDTTSSAGGSGGDLGSGGHAGTVGAGGALPKGGTVSAGGYYYNAGGTYYNSTGGYYYSSSGGYYYSTGGYYYNGSGGYYYNVGGSLASGGRAATGGLSVGGAPARGGTMSAGGSVNFGGSIGAAGGSNRVDGGFGGGGGSIFMPDAYVPQDVRFDGASDTIPTGGTIKLDGGFDPDARTCPSLASNEELIDNLNDGDRFIPLVNGRLGAWTDSHDASPSGKMFPDPLTGFVPTDTGDACRKFAAYVAGTGYVLYGADFWVGLGSPYDASKYTGISFWAKVDAGTTPQIRVNFPDKDTQPDGNICQANTTGTLACYDHYGYGLTLTTTWTKYTVPFSLIKQQGWGHAGTAFDPSSLYQILFSINVNATFGFWIDDIAFTM
jgi:hypothetical protein